MRCLNAGMGLVEALVAMLVLSIGMSGIGLMFVHSLQGSRSALLRSQAVTLVGDMADRIRANAAARGAYDSAAYAGGPSARGCAPDGISGSGNNCSATELAEDDLARWKSAVQTELPAATTGSLAADVQYLATLPESFRITVSWREPNEPAPFSYQTNVFVQASR